MYELKHGITIKLIIQAATANQKGRFTTSQECSKRSDASQFCRRVE